MRGLQVAAILTKEECCHTMYSDSFKTLTY